MVAEARGAGSVNHVDPSIQEPPCQKFTPNQIPLGPRRKTPAGTRVTRELRGLETRSATIKLQAKATAAAGAVDQTVTGFIYLLIPDPEP